VSTATIAASVDLRQARAAAIAAKGDVTILEDGSFSVASQSHTDVRYHVTADYWCECQDAVRHPGECKHGLAARALARAIAKAEAAAAAGTLGELERSVTSYAPARNQFEVDTLALVKRACRMVRARQRFACFDLIPAATVDDWRTAA